MTDSSISLSRTITILLWTLTGMLLLASWVTMAAGLRWTTPAMLGFTACVMAVISGVSQCRVYTLKVCCLMRTTAGIELEQRAELHGV